MAVYDKSVGPKEGKSAISGKTRKRIFGGDKGIGSFQDWQKTQGPVRTGETPAQPNDFYTGNKQLTLGDQQQLLANMFNPQVQAPAGAPADDSMEKLKMWIDFMREKQASDISQNPERVFNAAAQAQDPVRYAQENYQARLASDPWGPGGQFAGHTAAETMSPEAILASQGNNATNQWAQRGAVRGIDPEELKRLNASAAGRYRTYM